jgi:hypothetical protein
MCEPTFIGCLIDNHSVLHVEPRIRQNSHDSVCPTWVLVIPKLTRRISLIPDNRSLRVVELVRLGIGSVPLIIESNPQSLLSHLALVHVTRGLVVVAEWCFDSELVENV